MGWKESKSRLVAELRLCASHKERSRNEICILEEGIFLFACWMVLFGVFVFCNFDIPSLDESNIVYTHTRNMQLLYLPLVCPFFYPQVKKRAQREALEPKVNKRPSSKSQPHNRK